MLFLVYSQIAGMDSLPIEVFGSVKVCDMTCSKCDRVPMEPLSLQCGCTFCQSCFIKIIPLDKCSSCDTEFGRDSKKNIVTAPVYFISAKLKKMKLKCVNMKLGCLEEIEYGEKYQEHLRECKYGVISCSACSVKFLGKDLASHKRSINHMSKSIAKHDEMLDVLTKSVRILVSAHIEMLEKIRRLENAVSKPSS
ncbi:MAG: putative RING finger protein 151 [Hyperionvirus sp.]|uniref:Putative RING finger protein 151 n=1 Tax=Hyperionvirus sp. TaxID=2487770 RepID=A0A3G5AB19_9VIRU|nr:MAG: putative RING finger protein 151 [Hyperionvirus sp.]